MPLFGWFRKKKNHNIQICYWYLTYMCPEASVFVSVRLSWLSNIPQVWYVWIEADLTSWEFTWDYQCTRKIVLYSTQYL